jgi:hypothetical protein
MRKILGLALLCAVAPLALTCGGGGGGSGPTAPPAPVYPSVAGSWSGLWRTTVGLNESSRLDLVQGANGHVTGTFTTLSIPVDIEGTVTPGLGFTWHGLGNSAGCVQLNGDQSVDAVSPSRVSGTIDLNGSSCVPSLTRFVGPITMTRLGAAAFPGGRHASLQELATRLSQSKEN